MLYNLIRRLLFVMDPEIVHSLSLDCLKIFHKTGFTRLLGRTPQSPFKAFGLEFENRIGLAAGFDKNGDYLDALASLGFGFIEAGTVTPRPQPGNDRPRLFRIPEHHAVINRMGFNNKGVRHLVSQLEKARYKGVIGVNIGKNLTTPIENAHEDYLYCLKKIYPHAGYAAVNVSSPNTPGLRTLQIKERFKNLIGVLTEEREYLLKEHQRYVPLMVKISPDLNAFEIGSLAEVFNESNLDGIIATNTTVSKENIVDSRHASQKGGLSGGPLKRKAEFVLKALKKRLRKNALIIASGGIMSSKDALQRIHLGADLVQVYTGLIFSGPALIKEISSKIKMGVKQ